MMGSEDAQITCRFKTKLPEQYHVPQTEIAVPTKLTRYGLSQVINHLLGLEEVVPFDFLVNGELVRLPLGKFLLSKDITVESVLDVEYVFAVTPPDFQRQDPHDDWVGAVDGARMGAILTGCYDGFLRIWNGQGQVISSTPLHKGPISSLVSLPEAQGPLILSGGKLDHVIRLSEVLEEQGQPSSSGASAVAIYRGHGGSVLDVAAAPSGMAFVSASQDRSLRIWPTGAEVASRAAEDCLPAVAAPRKKQRMSHEAAVPSGGIEIRYQAELLGNTDAATAVAWSTNDRIYSGSMDHSVRKWDAKTGTNTDTYNDRKAVNCVAVPSSGRDLVAFAGAAKVLQIWDPRQRRAENAGVQTYTSHTSHIHAVAWHPSSEHYVVTASMDKTLKLWDLRSVIPLHSLEGHTEQVLCVGWWEGSKIISGSADKSVRIYQTAV